MDHILYLLDTICNETEPLPAILDKNLLLFSQHSLHILLGHLLQQYQGYHKLSPQSCILLKCGTLILYILYLMSKVGTVPLCYPPNY
jgi:hypothetical protein